METLFAEAHGTLEQIGGLFGQLERHVGMPEELRLEHTIQDKIQSLITLYDKLEIQILKDHPSRRQASRLRLNQMKYDTNHLKSSLLGFQKKRSRRERENSDRQELLSRRFTPNDTTSINIDYSIQHHNSLESAHRGIDDMISQGYNTLTNLRDQSSILKGTRKKLLDITNRLGLSNSVMQLIERRAYQDKFVLFGGMFLTVVLMFFLYMYFKV